MIKKTLVSKIIPLMLAVSIVTAFMYIYNKKLVLVFSLLSFIIQLGIFTFYDFLMTKGTVGKYCSILGGFAVVAALGIIAANGQADEAVDFMIWFMSPQAAVEYSARYTYILFAGLCFFIGSTVYYFTQIRYRIFVTFLILMIPLAIFAKEDERIPTLLLAVLLTMYTAVMIHCRQTADSEQKKNIRVILDGSYKKSALIFVFASVIISMACPKPHIEANREYFETMISANGLTQYLLSRLGEFSDTSSGTGFAGNSGSTKLFYVYAQETLNLKSRTFTDYNDTEDTWYTDSGYDRIYLYDWQDYQQNLNPANLIDAVYTACQYDSGFAEKYNIKKYSTDDYDLSEYTKKTVIVPAGLKPFYLPSPLHTFNVDMKDTFLMSPSGGIIKYSPETDSEAQVNIYAEISYYSDMLSDSAYSRNITENLNFEDYGVFLSDLGNILEKYNADEKFKDTVRYFRNDYLQAYDYYNGIGYQPVENQNFYQRQATESDVRYIPDDDVKKLAEEITKDCKSDIEKAEAIEMYFYNNNFEYDAEYVKPEGQNFKNFLFESHRGACYEYSTSMVMLARSAGLPARYNEGFMAADFDNQTGVCTITESNSHAYPEVFISGYGWLGFEPTLTDAAENQDGIFSSKQILIMIICAGAAAAAFIGALFVIFVYPVIYEKYFRIKIQKLSSSKTVAAVMKRLRKLTDTQNYITADEFSGIFYEKYGVDISYISQLFDIITYSSENTDAEKNTVINIYISAYQKIKEAEKQKNINHISA